MPLAPLQLDHDPEARVLAVSGDVDEQDVPTLADAVEELRAAGGGEVDLSGISYLPSLAVGVLVKHLKQAAADGVPLTLRARPGTIAQRILRVGGVPHEAR